MQAALHFQHPNQQLIVVPYSPHGTWAQSPVDNSAIHCGLQITISWLNGGNFEADTSCIEHLIPVDFKGVRQESIQVSLQVFGTPNLWE
jgi:hypothetical protein